MNKKLYALLPAVIKVAITPRFPVMYGMVSHEVLDQYKKNHPDQVITIGLLRRLAKSNIS